MRIRTVLTGRAPLMLHNIQLADPDNEWTKQIAAITSKRKKTEEDRRDIARLEWLGSLYLHDSQIVIPAANLKRCWQEAGKVSKKGRDVVRAVSPVELVIPLTYPGRPEAITGPEYLEALYRTGRYHDITQVGIGQKRVTRCRPMFTGWGLVSDWDIVPQVMDLDQVRDVIELAGKIEGLGDNRVNGYGRYEVGQIDVLDGGNGS